MDPVLLVVEPLTEYGQCRCCLAIGYHKDLMKEYWKNGKREVYYTMLTECFNLFLSSNQNLSTLICMWCIHQLQASYDFRNKIIESEQRMLARVSDSDTVFISVPTENLETNNASAKRENSIEIKEEVQDDHNYDENDDNDDHMDVDQPSCDVENQSNLLPFKNVDTSELIPEALELIARYRNKLKRLPRRDSLNGLYPMFVRQLNFFKDEIVTAETVENYLKNSKSVKGGVNLASMEKFALINNASLIIESSNVTPFRSRNRAGYPCFYCKRPFEYLKDLQEHQSGNHKRTEFNSVLSTYGGEAMVVYVDVTNLQCTICKEKIPNIVELKKHLVKAHNKTVYSEYHDKVVPFKLSINNIFECQCCGFSFETFGSIERHMSTHYRNYVCDKCGTGFITRHRLKIHLKSMHMPGNYTCENCKKVFKSQQKLKNHFETVHEAKKRFKCPKCPVRFTEYFQRQKHMETSHGVPVLEYKCNVCDRSFNRRYTLSRHLKRDHLEERDFQCDICAYKCFTKNELRGHMIKHNGERIHECAVCKKAYARKKTLREHMRIHANDRRFACEVCGAAFVQKCSLKGHIKAHHPEYDISI